MKFRLKADVVFIADDLDDACAELMLHFASVRMCGGYDIMKAGEMELGPIGNETGGRGNDTGGDNLQDNGRVLAV